MAQGKSTVKNAQPAAPAGDSDRLEQQVLAFAEQLGRVVGTVQARAEGWLDPKNLNEQITRVRDGASSLLQQLGAMTDAATERLAGGEDSNRASEARSTRSATTRSAGRSGGVVDAPGKKHRKPTPNQPIRANVAYAGRVAKMKAPNRNRRRGRG